MAEPDFPICLNIPECEILKVLGKKQSDLDNQNFVIEKCAEKDARIKLIKHLVFYQFIN